MSYKFGRRSMKHLDTCHTKLKALAVAVIEHIDLSVLEGHRTKQIHDALPPGATQVPYEDSRHSKLPSEAIHMTPYPYPKFEDSNPTIKEKAYREQCKFAGYVQCKADELGIKIRWGGDWDMDGSMQDQNFDDLCHWELVEDNNSNITGDQ